jgi:hypothetical protein
MEAGEDLLHLLMYNCEGLNPSAIATDQSRAAPVNSDILIDFMMF